MGGKALKRRVVSIIQADPWNVEWSGVMAGSGLVVGGWAEDLEFNTYMIVKDL